MICIFGKNKIYGVSAEEDEDVEDEEDEKNPYTLFIKGLQEQVADNDAVIICEAGNEKLRYVTGFAMIPIQMKTMRSIPRLASMS